MDLASAYKNKSYLFEKNQNEIEDGEKIVAEILKNTPIKDCDSVEFLSSNFEYDSYKVVKDRLGYCVKYSFDSSSNILQHENSILQHTHPYTPSAIDAGSIKFGDLFHYSVSSFEFAENARDFGLASLLTNWSSFFRVFSSIENVQCKRSFANYLRDLEQRVDLNNLPSDALAAIKDQYDFDRLNLICSSIMQQVYFLCSIIKPSKPQLCHGKLQPSNILHRSGMFKMIDFTDSFMGNRYFDLARLSIYLGLDAPSEKKMLSEFFASRNEQLNASLWEEYRECYDVMIRIVFLEIVSNFLKEVYVLSSQRPRKIWECIELFSKNSTPFYRLIPIVQENYQFVSSVVVSPMIGSSEDG